MSLQIEAWTDTDASGTWDFHNLASDLRKDQI